MATPSCLSRPRPTQFSANDGKKLPNGIGSAIKIPSALRGLPWCGRRNRTPAFQARPKGTCSHRVKTGQQSQHPLPEFSRHVGAGDPDRQCHIGLTAPHHDRQADDSETEHRSPPGTGRKHSAPSNTSRVSRVLGPWALANPWSVTRSPPKPAAASRKRCGIGDIRERLPQPPGRGSSTATPAPRRRSTRRSPSTRTPAGTCQ